MSCSTDMCRFHTFSSLLFRGSGARWPGVAGRLRIAPSAILIDESVCLLRSPTLRCVLVYGGCVAENGVYYLPLRFNGVFAHEEGFVTLHGIAEESFVRSHLVGCLVNGDKLNIFTVHRLTRNFSPRAHRNFDDRTDTEAIIIRLRRFSFPKRHLWRTLEFNCNLSCGYGQFFARPDVERHIGPAPGVNK